MKYVITRDIEKNKEFKKSLTYSGHKLYYRTTFQGLPISIENRKGSVRRGVDPDGHKWETKMKYPYGYIRLTEGVDGDHVDCYLGPNKDSRKVYVIHQKNPDTGEYDEDKVMLGFNSAKEAKEAFLAHYDKPGFYGGMDSFDIEEFKKLLKIKKREMLRIRKARKVDKIKYVIKALPKKPEKKKPLPSGAHRRPPKGYPDEREKYAIPGWYAYPLDTEKHVRAAISYFSMPRNYSKFTPEERRSIWKRILRAAKKFGIEVSEDVKKRAGDTEGDNRKVTKSRLFVIPFVKARNTIKFFVSKLFEKARKDHLIPKRVLAVRNGKTYWTTRWVKPGENVSQNDQLELFANLDKERKEKTSWGNEDKSNQTLVSGEKEGKEVVIGKNEEERYHDVGEKIGGAKKDIWAEKLMTDSLDELEKNPQEAYRVVTKDNLLGKFDIEFYRSQGYSSAATQFIKEFYASIAKRPPDDPKKRQAFVLHLRDIDYALRNARKLQDVFMSICELIVMKQKADPLTEYYKKGYWLYKHKDGMSELMEVIGPKAANYLRTIYKVMEETDKGLGIKYAYYLSLSGTTTSWKRYKELKKYISTLSERESKNPDDWSWTEKKRRPGTGGEPERWVRKVDEKVERIGGREVNITTPEEYISRFGVRAVEYGNYVAKDKEAAEYHTKRCAEAFADLADILGISDKETSLKGRLALAFGARGSGKASAHYEPTKKVINLTKFRGGGSLAHEWFHFLDNILYEVEVGREKGKGKVYFLSQGRYGYRQASKNVSNAVNHLMNTLEKTHEDIEINVEDAKKAELPDKLKRYADYYWKLAINHFADLKESRFQDPVDFCIKVSQNHQSPNGIRWGSDPEYKKVIKEWVKRAVQVGKLKKVEERLVYGVTRDSDFAIYAAKRGGYWNRSQEKAARAFEAYIEDKLEKKGRKNTYLVSGTKANYGYAVYPQGKHREEVYDAFEKLIGVLKKNNSFKKALEVMEMRYLIKSCSSSKQEAAWKRAKAIVRKEYPDISEDDERFYKLVNKIYQNIISKSKDPLFVIPLIKSKQKQKIKFVIPA